MIKAPGAHVWPLASTQREVHKGKALGDERVRFSRKKNLLSINADVSEPWYLWFPFYLVWTQDIPPSPLGTVISLFRSLVKSAPNMLQTLGEERGVWFMALREMLTYAQSSVATGFTMYIILG